MSAVNPPIFPQYLHQTLHYLCPFMKGSNVSTYDAPIKRGLKGSIPTTCSTGWWFSGIKDKVRSMIMDNLNTSDLISSEPIFYFTLSLLFATYRLFSGH